MISPDLLSRINCSTCLENINSGLITPGKLVQMDIGYNGFKVFRIGSPRFFTTEERPNRVDLTATPITHLSLRSLTSITVVNRPLVCSVTTI